MLKTTFQKMAADVDAWAGPDAEEFRAGLVIHALEVAHDHDLGTVRAFASGCDDNGYASDLRPMFMASARLSDWERVRALMRGALDGQLVHAWNEWKGEGEEKAGLARFLACRGRTRENRQLVA